MPSLRAERSNLVFILLILSIHVKIVLLSIQIEVPQGLVAGLVDIFLRFLELFIQ